MKVTLRQTHECFSNQYYTNNVVLHNWHIVYYSVETIKYTFPWKKNVIIGGKCYRMQIIGYFPAVYLIS